jgi:protocatechuate 3,4-dioxygenase, alpha subunit
MAGITPSQTAGPYFGILLRGRAECRQVTDATRGTRISIEGRVLDGAGNGISDALIETWQADASGRYHHPEDCRPQPADPAFNGFGWAHTREDGGYRFETIKPGRVPGPDGANQAPHVDVSIMGRGILTRFITRIYFEDESANADDPILGLVPAARRDTLIARRVADGQYVFDIVMQGPRETVFFDV